ncbi:hypothetical protein CBX96_12260 [Shewanella sp. BC20]|uniref:hypothetical protein n=1 Tax=Shewanella sp. BC20 TaxID=2004459 RepID=UPI000D65DB14|nr:hypothetical protein [Shewanella sp. BC20]PWF62964.1 hypothetical protein CBX96_12260 [Shewanella sp. BC20]
MGGWIYFLQGGDGNSIIDISSLKDKYDISSAPEHIKMAKGLNYTDLSEAEKYAAHIADSSLVETIRLAQESDDPQMRGVTMKSINAVWYSNPKSKGAWSELDTSYAMGSYRAGENIQFNGQLMKELLPGGKGIPGGQAMLRQGYALPGFYGIRPGKRAFNYVVGHEVEHTTSLNARSRNAESNADSFYMVLFEGN